MSLTTTTTPFGQYTTPNDPTNPISVTKYTLTNTATSFSVSIIDYGAAITNLFVRDANGDIIDIVLGFDTLEEYLGITSFENPYFGATIGRTSNRVRRGQFTLSGTTHQLSLNDGENHLHGGFFGFDKRQFKGTIIKDGAVAFSYFSQDNEEGYPNGVLATVTFSITEDNELILEYKAMADGPTPITMTNHSYFNLTGHKTADSKLEFHTVKFNANTYTPVDSSLIITGQVEPVQGTRFDLRSSTDIHELLNNDPTGFDHNLCINGANGETLVQAATIATPNLTMTIRTTQPGIQFYTGNFLPTTQVLMGKEGFFYYKNGAMCLETQAWPDSVNHSNFPNVFYNPGQVYEAKCIYAFT